MAKPALGKGLGDLLQDNGARETAAATEARTTTPRLSAGLSTLVHRPASSGPETPPSNDLPRAVRAALLAGDAALTVGAVLLFRSRPADAPTIALTAGAVLLGAWLGWLALVPRQPAR